MPDTSPVADNPAALIGGATVFLGGLLAWLGRILASKEKAEHPLTHVPEAAGVSMTLIDQATQAEIAKDTERTADTLGEIRDLLRDQVEIQAEQRERQESEKLRQRLDEADEDRREMMRMIRELRDQGAKHKPGRPLSD